MARYGGENDSKKQTQFYFRGAGISRTEQKEINQMLGRGFLGILAFAMIASIFARPTEPIATYLSSEEIAASQIQSEKAAYQNHINATVNDCSSALNALSRHEQSNHTDSNEAVDRQIQLINLKDKYCN